MLKIPTTAPITLGTDVDLIVTSMSDHDGTAIDPLTAEFEITFYCGKSAPYKVTPTEHAKIKDGKLHLLFEGWPTDAGMLHYTEHYATDNDLFADGKQDVRGHYYTDLKFNAL